MAIIVVSSLPQEFRPISRTEIHLNSKIYLEGFARMRAIQLLLIGLDTEPVAESLGLDEVHLNETINLSINDSRKGYQGEPVVTTYSHEYFNQVEVLIEMVDGEILLNR